VQRLFEPFEKRFNFHFYGDLRTNNDTKPEWFFTQVLTWLKKEARTTQEALEEKLISLAVKKARCLTERVASDSVLFSHLIDEAVAFENELKDAGYTALVGKVLSVFCEASLLNRWLELERESCTTGVENVLMSDARWKNRYSEVADLDLHRVPECTDQFIVLIESMTERYRWIRDVDVQARFLELQVLMLDEYRLRLVQISQQLSSPWEEPFVQLLNSFWYIGCVLEEWNDAEAFLKVQTRGANIRLRGIFDDMAEMYRHVWRQRATDMAIAFHQFVRVQLTAYAKLNWFSMDGTKPTDITPSFCPFLLEIRLLLGRIAASISPDSAFTLYSLLNEKIADALMQLIEGTSFNYQGAIQMLFDITSSLLPLLNSLYSRSATTTYE
uniref:RAD50-interacting protein 1 n=1 Tax=Parascaris univalens TaxID=6257 RepID=A0A914ZEY4_PARUN